MPEPLRAFWITVEVERGRTRDHRLIARSSWAAWWLWKQMHPGQTVVMVREVK